MTFIKLVEKIKIIQLEKKIKEITLKCDECNIIYICSGAPSRALKSNLHFCSKACSILSISNGVLKKKQEATTLEKYGSKSYFGTDQYKVEMEDLCMEAYGVKSWLEAPAIQDKIKSTNLEKYGQETYTGSKDHESKLNRSDIAQKAWATKIKNGTCSKSKVEERVFGILQQEYAEDDVLRQVSTIKQWVDFYVTSLQLYIQVDGTYWHGLNRTLEEISLHKTTQDEKIHKQILRDQKLNEYMKDNNLKILRITDEEINEMLDEEILLKIKESANANL